jgi:hypothetical protein
MKWAGLNSISHAFRQGQCDAARDPIGWTSRYPATVLPIDCSCRSGWHDFIISPLENVALIDREVDAMRRALPIFAAVFAGTTLLFLIVQAIFSERQPVETGSPRPEQVTAAEPHATIENEIEAAPMEVDPVVRMAEIAQLRESRGTVLAGTILAGAESCDDFNVALAQFTGAEPPSPESRKAEVISLLRRTAHELDEHAYQYEQRSIHRLAMELRDCAQEIRKSIRYIEGAVEKSEPRMEFFGVSR